MGELFTFGNGTITVPLSELFEGAPAEERLTVPVPFYVYRHGPDIFLLDCGSDPRTVEDPAAVWPWPYEAAMRKEETVPARLAEIGLTPADLTAVVLSHGHGDHAGAVPSLPAEIPILLQRAEWGPGLPIPEGRLVELLDGETEIAPGLTALPTPGHTRGHQSFLVELPRAGRILLAADAVYLRRSLDEGRPSGTYVDRAAMLATMDRLQSLEAEGVRLFFGHDPAEFAAFPRHLD
jgi:N-acyl homoserine lactone hydrolase